MCPLDLPVNGIIDIAIPAAMCCRESSIGPWVDDAWSRPVITYEQTYLRSPLEEYIRF
jgi:hypothetical protein